MLPTERLPKAVDGAAAEQSFCNVQAGSIPARIDSQNKVLYARHADQRHATFQKALTMGDEYMRDTKALLLRLHLLRESFTVKADKTWDAEGHGSSKSTRQERSAVGPTLATSQSPF